MLVKHCRDFLCGGQFPDRFATMEQLALVPSSVGFIFISFSDQFIAFLFERDCHKALDKEAQASKA